MSYTGENGQDLNALVADIGSFNSRVGYAGEDFPKCNIRSVSILMHVGEKVLLCVVYKYNLSIHFVHDRRSNNECALMFCEIVVGLLFYHVSVYVLVLAIFY